MSVPSDAAPAASPGEGRATPRGKLRGDKVTLSHGAGGKAMHELIEEVFLASFGSTSLDALEDQARVRLAELTARGDRLAFTTDSFVVDPLFFPGGDIGSLAVYGTVNDLAVSGAVPLYLSFSVIIEEGLPLDTLRRVAASVRHAADAAGVQVVTGDTKVVNRGAADKLFINTSGIGVIREGIEIAAKRVRPGDAILVNGAVGDHAVAILNARRDLGVDASVLSDSQPLHALVQAMLAVCPDIRCLRDLTRGGLATVLNEIARAARVGMHIDEQRVPVKETVRGVCAILGLDPLYFANEGKLAAVVPRAHAESVVSAMRRCPAGADATIIGEVAHAPEGLLVLHTGFGGERIVDTLIGEQLPRIC